MRARCVSSALFAALVMLALAPPAFAGGDDSEREQARAHFRTGEALFDEGRYAEAKAEFHRADAIFASPINSYNIALCHDRLGDAAAAIREYRAYLSAMPKAPNRRDVEARISALRAQLQARDPSRTDDAARGRADEEPVGGEPYADAPSGDVSPYVEAEEELRRPGSGDGPPPGGWGAEGAGATGADYGGRAAPAEPPDRSRSDRPVYRSWWFWGVAGVSALILYNIATASSSSDSAASLEFFDASPGGAGMTLLRF